MDIRLITYDYASFTVDTGESDFDVADEVNALFNNVTVAKNVVIFFDQEINIKFNSTLMPVVTFTKDMSPFRSPPRFLDLKNIYLTNTSGTMCKMSIWLW